MQNHLEKLNKSNRATFIVGLILLVISFLSPFGPSVNSYFLVSGGVTCIVSGILMFISNMMMSDVTNQPPSTGNNGSNSELLTIIAQQKLLNEQALRLIEDRNDELKKKEKELQIQEQLTDQANYKVKNKEHELEFINARLEMLGFNPKAFSDSEGVFPSYAIQMIRLKLNGATYNYQLTDQDKIELGITTDLESSAAEQRTGYIMAVAESIAPFLKASKQ